MNKVGGKNSMLRCEVGDETGVSKAFLPDVNEVQVDESIVLFKAQGSVVKEHIELQLERGGRIDKARRRVDKVNDEFSLSFKAWVPMD